MIDRDVFQFGVRQDAAVPGPRRSRRPTYVALTEPAQQTAVTVPPDFPWLSPTPGRSYQIAFSAWRRGHGDGRNHPQAAMEMGLGTGKTLIGLEEILKLKKAQGGRVTALMLVPNSVIRTVWDVQLPIHAPGLRYAILDGPMVKRRAFLKNNLGTVDLIVHSTDSYGYMADALNAIPWDFAGIDEHQDFRNHMSMRGKALLGRGARFRNIGPLGARTKLIGSGTPAIKRATDIYVPYKWLTGELGSIAQFRTQFVIMGGFGGHEEVGLKPGADKVLRAFLDRHRFVVPQGVLGFAEPVFHYRRVNMPDWQSALYKKVQRELLTEVDGEVAHIVNPLTEMLRLAQVTEGFEATDKDTYHWRDDNAKASYLFDVVLPEVFDGEERAIVWAWFRPTIANLARMAAERGYRPVTFTGGAAGDKVAAQEAFKSGEANLFIGQMRAGGRGLNLGENRTMVYYGRSADTEAYIQSLGRDQRADSSNRLIRNRIIIEAENSVDQIYTGILKGDISMASLFSSVRLKEILGIGT